MQQPTLTVMIVDDHPLMRRGIRQLLALEPLFHSPLAQELWLDAARGNLRDELDAFRRAEIR